MWKTRYRKVTEQLQKSRKLRIAVALCTAAAAGAGALYLYFHDPYSYPLPCTFYLLTGLYCPGCGAGRASYSILHGRFLDAFCYNPLMTVLFPLIALYVIVRMADWAVTGGNHIDRRISVRLLTWVLVLIFVYGVLRNIPVFPFNLLAPGGLSQIL